LGKAESAALWNTSGGRRAMQGSSMNLMTSGPLFIESRKLPKFFEDYKHADPNTSLESLHLELKHHRGTTKNINQYLHIMRAFNPLREDLLTAMKDFDRDWRGYSIKE